MLDNPITLGSMGVSINSGTSKWLVVEKPTKTADLGVPLV